MKKTVLSGRSSDDLTNTREDRLFLYVAAHGTGKRIGGLKAKTGMKIPAMFKAVQTAANYSNIEGVVIGSCSVGNNIGDFISTTKNSRIAWIFGYTCEIGWMASTLIDLSLFEHLMKLKKRDLCDREKIVNTFVKALHRFNGDYILCKGRKGAPGIALKDCTDHRDPAAPARVRSAGRDTTRERKTGLDREINRSAAKPARHNPG